jgi:hypothetical protein
MPGSFLDTEENDASNLNLHEKRLASEVSYDLEGGDEALNPGLVGAQRTTYFIEEINLKLRRKLVSDGNPQPPSHSVSRQDLLIVPICAAVYFSTRLHSICKVGKTR